MKKNLHDASGVPPCKLMHHADRCFWRKKLLLLAAFLMCAIFARAQSTVSGTVKDETGQAVPGVSVMVKGATVGMITDKKGHYNLTVPGGSGVLVFTMVGYVRQEVETKGRSTIDVNL